LAERDAEPEERLLIEAARREPARFAELYERHFHRVYAFIARRVHNRDEVQDLTADVFHQALANLGRFEWRGAPFATWLFRIAANAIADRGRRAAVRQQVAPPDLVADLPDPMLNPSDEKDELLRLAGFVGALPNDQRLVIELRFLEQKSIRLIAEKLGKTEGAVKQLQFRAIKTLRAQMGITNV
jgi:RNA polymerase sigma-70 factor (ECF subfamily)